MSRFGIAVVGAWLVQASVVLAAPPSPPVAPATKPDKVEARPPAPPSAPAKPLLLPTPVDVRGVPGPSGQPTPAYPSAVPPLPGAPGQVAPPATAVAKTVRSLGDRSVAGDDLRVEAHETVQDVEAFGGDVLILGHVMGDVRAVGGDVRIKGPVAGDVELLGGDLRVDDRVLGTVKSFGGDVRVDGVINGDLIMEGGDVSMGPQGRVLGDVRNDGDADPTNLLASISPLPAWAKRIVPGMISVPTFALALLKLMAWVGAWFVALMLLWLDRLRLTSLTESLVEDPLRSFAWGAVVSVGLLFGAGLIAVTIIGLPVAGVLIMLFGAALYLGLSVSAAALGAWLPLRWLARRPVLQITVGTLLLAGHSLLPWFGALLMFAVSLMGVGAVVLTYRAPRPRTLQAGPALGAFL